MLKHNLIYGAALIAILTLTTGFAHMRKEHKDVDCKLEGVIAGETTKMKIVERCGLAPLSRIVGKYELMEYDEKSEKVGKAIGLGILGGLAGGVPLERMAGNYKKEAVIFIDINTGVVRDFYYHDYDRKNGHDESESLVLEADEKFEDGKIDEAMSLLKRAISSNDRNHRAFNKLAWIMLEMNLDPKGAMGYAKKAMEIFPDSPYNNGTLGMAYLRSNDRDQAKKYLKQALKLFELYFPTAYTAIEHDKALLVLAGG